MDAETVINALQSKVAKQAVEIAMLDIAMDHAEKQIEGLQNEKQKLVSELEKALRLPEASEPLGDQSN
jgi:hypothetical protein